jgi:hypothetical protein
LQLSMIEVMHARIDRLEAIEPITIERSTGELKKGPLAEAALLFGSVRRVGIEPTTYSLAIARESAVPP